MKADENKSHSDGHRFNDDLLVTEADQTLAREIYPRIAYALDHPELRERFLLIDPLANTAKRVSRRSGTRAVILVTVALLIASAEPLYHPYHDFAVAAALASAGLGLIGTLIGVMGMLYARSKRDWLSNRLRTEQMRLFHYRTILELADLILSSQRDEFLRRRAVMFREFEQDVLARPAVALESVLDADWPGERLIPHVPPLPERIDSVAEAELLRAYWRLRIQRQLGYTQYKLQTDGRLLSKFPRQQAFWLEVAASICIVGTIIVHLLVVVGTAFGSWPVGPMLHVLGIWLAIMALGLKTLQEGLQPKQEVERYRHYRAAIRAVGDRFDAAGSLAEKLAAATVLERASADEMIIFLRSGWEARFVM